MIPTPQDQDIAAATIKSRKIVIHEMVSKEDGLLLKGELPDVSVVCDFNELQESIAQALADERDRLAKGLSEAVQEYLEKVCDVPAGTPVENGCLDTMLTYLKSQGCDLKE